MGINGQLKNQVLLTLNFSKSYVRYWEKNTYKAFKGDALLLFIIKSNVSQPFRGCGALYKTNKQRVLIKKIATL